MAQLRTPTLADVKWRQATRSSFLLSSASTISGSRIAFRVGRRQSSGVPRGESDQDTIAVHGSNRSRPNTKPSFDKEVSRIYLRDSVSTGRARTGDPPSIPKSVARFG